MASRERLADLEKKLEDPSSEERVRLLGGIDPEPEILSKKIEELEMRLADKEEKLLEKDLIYEEVTRLADRTKKKAESGKLDTLELAKKVGANDETADPVGNALLLLIKHLTRGRTLPLVCTHNPGGFSPYSRRAGVLVLCFRG